MGPLKNLYIAKMVEYLASEGERIAKLALETKQTRNRTFNQADAFGYIVFYNRAIMQKGYAQPSPASTTIHKGWPAMGVPDGTGREWLDDFIESWKPESRGFVLIVVNAAFYSDIQERGGGNLKTSYQIITQIWNEMENLQSQFKGATLALKSSNSR